MEINANVATILEPLNVSWDAAFNANQPQQLMEMYDEAAALMPSGAAQVTGAKEILEFWTNLKAQGVIDHKIEMIEAIADGGLALQRGLWSAAVINAEGERQEFKGNVHLVHRRQPDGSWKILTHIWN
jgi:ketosteroid isomerase-like protein